jgi:hypothetical protein
MISKETKNIHGLLLFFGIHESSISSLNIFTPKIIGRISLSATPAARAPHSTRGSLPSANAEILTVIFWYKKIRASRG